MKRFLARAYWLAGIAVAALLILTVAGMVLYGVLFMFREIIPSIVAGLVITAFLFLGMDLWHRCDYYLKSSNDNKDS